MTRKVFLIVRSGVGLRAVLVYSPYKGTKITAERTRWVGRGYDTEAILATDLSEAMQIAPSWFEESA